MNIMNIMNIMNHLYIIYTYFYNLYENMLYISKTSWIFAVCAAAIGTGGFELQKKLVNGKR